MVKHFRSLLSLVKFFCSGHILMKSQCSSSSSSGFASKKSRREASMCILRLTLQANLWHFMTCLAIFIVPKKFCIKVFKASEPVCTKCFESLQNLHFVSNRKIMGFQKMSFLIILLVILRSFCMMYCSIYIVHFVHWCSCNSPFIALAKFSSNPNI